MVVQHSPPPKPPSSKDDFLMGGESRRKSKILPTLPAAQSSQLGESFGNLRSVNSAMRGLVSYASPTGGSSPYTLSSSNIIVPTEEHIYHSLNRESNMNLAHSFSRALSGVTSTPISPPIGGTVQTQEQIYGLQQGRPNMVYSQQNLLNPHFQPLSRNSAPLITGRNGKTSKRPAINNHKVGPCTGPLHILMRP